MNVPFRKADLALATAMAASLVVAGCDTQPDVIEEAPIDESTVVDADAPGVGTANPEGGAEPATAVPGDDVYGGETESEPEPPSGAEATNDIEND